MKKPKKYKISLEVLETTAHIMGPSSGAAKALMHIKNNPGEYRFWKEGDYILVELIKEGKKL